MSDPIKLDLGCGTKKKDGHIGVDVVPFPGVDVVCDVGKDRWPWNDESVDEVHCSHMLEHLWPWERVHFANECYRVLKRGGKAQIVVPHWASGRYYGDVTHKSPPVGEAWLYHLGKAWRDEKAPHENQPSIYLDVPGCRIEVPAYTCDFAGTFSFSLQPSLQGRNPDYVQFALSFYKESAMDLLFGLNKA